MSLYYAKIHQIGAGNQFLVATSRAKVAKVAKTNDLDISRIFVAKGGWQIL